MGTLQNRRMRFIIVLFCFIVYAQCNELIVKGDAVDRIFCCNQVQSRCTMACAGSDCSRTCSGLCGIFGTRCGPWTCSALNPGTCTAAPVPVAAPVPAPLPPLDVGGR